MWAQEGLRASAQDSNTARQELTQTMDKHDSMQVTLSALREDSESMGVQENVEVRLVPGLPKYPFIPKGRVCGPLF